MKNETIYVILDLMGRSWVVKNQDREKVDLNHLLAEGWRPTRETPFGDNPSILIRLERELEGQMGFGFGK
jgi:hypothetical protein